MARAHPFLGGLALAVGIGLPATIVANVVAELGDLPATLSSALVLVVLVGAVVGGAAVGRRDAPGAPWQAAAIGFVDLAILTFLGWTRRTVSGEDVDPVVIPALAVIGALFGGIGGAIGLARAGRTRG